MRYLWTSIKLQFRIPISIFFSLLFPLIMMFAMVSSYGNFDIGNGYHFVDKYFLISTGMGMLPISLISFPIWLGESIQNQSYKRLEYFGLSTQSMIISDVCSYVLLTALSIIANILFGFLMYGLHIPNVGYLIAYVIQCLYSNLVLLIFGALIALVVKNTRVLMPVGMILLFSSYILTGAFSSFSELPESFQSIGKFIPMKYVMNDFFNIWIEKEIFTNDFLVLNTVFGIILTMILVLLFVWNKKKKE
ncbi:ABC transporter permease [Candidatus Enterococcus ikei]|uniref:ABC transporter permease n=1 Tax=Candidatus Enterococcus ikei TaxID=2815326 RepID=A0ABS3GXC8_9ENTE|nr:ABC transporter permease [Enterococcus sp. DIV0869a]